MSEENPTLVENFEDIADAIREKGVTGTMRAIEMPAKIRSIVQLDPDDYYKKSETSSASEISTAFENIDLSGYATKDEVSSLSDAVKFEADNDSNKTAVTIGTRLAGVGAQSLAVGTNNTVNGARAFAAGAYNNVNANDSAAIGASNTVSETKSLAVGNNNSISAENALAVGAANVANGRDSLAVGMGVSAEATTSFAGGQYSNALCATSFAWGSFAKSESPSEFAIGRCNASHVYDSSLDNPEASSTVFAVGIGESQMQRANGLEVMLNGDTYLKGLGGYDGANLSTGIPLQQMLGTQFVLSGEYEDDTTFEISVYGYTPPPPPPPKWFTLKNVGSSSGSAAASLTSFSLEYSTDGGDSWSAYSSGTSLTLEPDDEVKFRHTGTDSTGKHITFSTTGDLAVSGNIMTLLDETGESTTLSDKSIFESMFQDQSIVDASGLELPATTLAKVCYGRMFSNCTSLTAAPEVLPAMTLADSCYSSMFEECPSLVIAPELPATTLADYCYRAMFADCSALTQAPELPATTVPRFGYASMFKGCTNLTSISVSMPEWYYNIGWANTSNWVQGVSANGTFKCPTALGTDATIQRGNDYCPTGWTVVNI